MSSIPEGVKQPQDRQSPAQREAESDGPEMVEFEFEGHQFSILADPLDWPTRALRAFEDGKGIAAVTALLGQKRYNKLGIDDWPARKTNALFEKFAQLAGLDDAGE